MNKTIGITELQRKFQVIFNEVIEKHVPYVLTRGSRPEAVLVPYAQYLKFVRADERGILKRFDELLARMAIINAKYPEAQVEVDLKEATQTVRSQNRHKRNALSLTPTFSFARSSNRKGRLARFSRDCERAIMR